MRITKEILDACETVLDAMEQMNKEARALKEVSTGDTTWQQLFDELMERYSDAESLRDALKRIEKPENPNNERQ